MRRLLALLALGVVAMSGLLLCQSAPANEGERAWQALRPLAGEWAGTGGGGEPGEVSASGISFKYDLKGHVLVRKSFTAFRATASRPAFQHDDLTVIYPGDGGPPRAIYFDDEGHRIEYAVTASADGKKIECLSAAAPGGPLFRLTYEFTSPDELKIRFDIAPPGQTDKFKTHVEGTLRRAGK